MAEAVWGEGHQDGGPPSWRRLFWVEDKMAELPSVGFYLFGVEDKMEELPSVGFYLFGVVDAMMEAHHHGGANLGWRTRWRSSCVEDWGEGGQDGGPPSWWIPSGVKDVKMEVRHDGSSIFLGPKPPKMETPTQRRSAMMESPIFLGPKPPKMETSTQQRSAMMEAPSFWAQNDSK